MAAFEIPVASRPQTFTARLAGVTFNFRLYWNVPAGCWMLDIADVNDDPLANGVALVTGADLLGQLGYLGISGQLYAYCDQDIDQVPGWTDLGITGHIVFMTGLLPPPQRGLVLASTP
jgi:hypothetical protein